MPERKAKKHQLALSQLDFLPHLFLVTFALVVKRFAVYFIILIE
jgi:hypothetical protein